MKSVLITFDQAYYERIMALLDVWGCRGFTYLEKSTGTWFENRAIRISEAMPGQSMCSAILTVVEDKQSRFIARHLA